MRKRYNRDRTQIRYPYMEGCDPEVIKKENERLDKLNKRRKKKKDG